MVQEKNRGFEVVTSYLDQGIQLPQRSTYLAAGYDIQAAEDTVLKSYWKVLFQSVAEQAKQWIRRSTDQPNITEDAIWQPTLVPTGIKAYMQDNEYLQIVNRSSNPIKRRLILPNGIGIIDADYYNNENNEGHIYVQLLNFGLKDVKIKKGERIAQGIFMPYYLADNDTGGLIQRTGGFGSSNSIDQHKE